MGGKLNKGLTDCFNLHPKSLSSSASNYHFIHGLYDSYMADLVPFCERMVNHRREVCDKGYSCDFSDRESELLYLLIRELKPETVVEISPCHGYSTNYILAALTHNNKGRVYSFEIIENVAGVAIEDVIRGNILEGLDQKRLELCIGDATLSYIPDPDFLFLDSCHEAWFSAWYVNELVGKPKICFVHDIAIYHSGYKSIIPKAPFMGIRESYYLLESLAINDQKCMAVADFVQNMNQSLMQHLPIRNENAAERSVIFKGFKQNEKSLKSNAMQLKIKELACRLINGDRSVVKEVIDIVTSDATAFTKLNASLLLPLAGYRIEAVQNEFSVIDNVLKDIVKSDDISVASLVASLELGAQLNYPNLVRETIAAGKRSTINPGTLKALTAFYYSFSLPLNKCLAEILRQKDKIVY